MINKIIWALLGCTLVGGFFILISCGGEIKSGGAKVDHPAVTGVKAIPVQPQTVPEYFEGVGTVKSINTSVVSSKVMAAVREVRVKEGDRVHAGQVLMLLDDREGTAQLSKARAGTSEVQQALVEADQGIRAADANRQFAAATYNRFKDLYEKKSVSPHEFEEVESKYKGAQAAYQSMLARKEQIQAKEKQVNADTVTAQTLVSYSRITAPLDGIVTQKNVDVGTMAAPGVPLIVVEDTSNYRLEVAVEDAEINKVKLNDPVQVQIDALGPATIPGRVAEIVPASDPATRSNLVKVSLTMDRDKPGQRTSIRSGLYGKALFVVSQKKALLVPRKSIIQQGQLEGIFVVDGSDLAHLRLVKTGKAYGESLEVLAGLKAGEKVVVENVGIVRDGTQLR
ncbi:MAG: efflux RND transporter periplasmic adaptor subunit [Acidobacteriia bacterium]|nr:efflux RND transporter periplasmic adaptor subunit [Terriglobia bacterium]